MDWIGQLVDGIDWAAMVHCRGPASDVPELLRASVRGDPDARDRLFDCLCYQGSIFEPTAAAAPVFVAALRRPEAADWGLAWIRTLARAYTMTEGQGLLRWVAEDDPERPAVEARYAEEQGWVRRCHRAAWDAVPDVLALLDVEEADQERILAVPHVLVLALQAAEALEVPEPERAAIASRLVALCEVRHRRLDGSARAADLGAMGAVAQLVPEAAGPLHEALTGPQPAAAVAAIFLAGADPDRVPRDEEAVAASLGAALARVDEHEGWFPREDWFPWLWGHLRFTLVQALCGLSNGALDARLGVIADVLRVHANATVYAYLAAPVVARVLDGCVLTSETRRRDLPPRALPILDALLASPLWDEPRNATPTFTMEPLGLVYDRAWWERMLA